MANPPVRYMHPSAQRGRAPVNLGGSAIFYTVADLYLLVKQYDEKFVVNPHDSISQEFLNSDGTPKAVFRDPEAFFPRTIKRLFTDRRTVPLSDFKRWYK